MKKIIVPVFFLVSLGIISYVLFTNANNDILSNEEAIKIGEEKYLKFLWMVDGAFNSERKDDDFIVNGKKLDEKEKIFTCKYSNENKEKCVGNNFEEEFKDLFTSNIEYDDVYSDGYIYKWIDYNNGKYVFSNIYSCNVNRMSISHNLEISKITKDKLIFKVNFIDNQTNYEYNKEFILTLEDNVWKVSKAYYYDLCGIKYNIR